MTITSAAMSASFFMAIVTDLMIKYPTQFSKIDWVVDANGDLDISTPAKFLANIAILDAVFK